ncbi:MAG: hypothetical protein EWM72_02839 [Nitrospira sp.]|nr:MAG: hypothetical protein EWM72_02839 [Nitrospira sp.]
MVRKTVSNPTTPTVSAGTLRVSPTGKKAGPDGQASKGAWHTLPLTLASLRQAGPDGQASKGAWAHDRIARRAHELYEKRGRQEGRALEDWLNAEQQVENTVYF